MIPIPNDSKAKALLPGQNNNTIYCIAIYSLVVLLGSKAFALLSFSSIVYFAGIQRASSALAAHSTSLNIRMFKDAKCAAKAFDAAVNLLAWPRGKFKILRQKGHFRSCRTTLRILKHAFSRNPKPTSMVGGEGE